MATAIKVTECCGEIPETMGSTGQYWYQCPKCKKGSYFYDLPTKNKYYPDEYERTLECRIEALEKRIADLELEVCASVEVND